MPNGRGNCGGGGLTVWQTKFIDSIMSTIFIDESGDTGFKLDSGSSPYFILSAVVFETSVAIIEASNRIQDLLQEGRYNTNFEFHFGKNKEQTKIKFLEEVSQMQFYWYSICIDKSKIVSPQMKQNSYLLTKISTYLCNNFQNKAEKSKIIFDKKDSLNFYRQLSKALKWEFNQSGVKIKEIVSKDSHKERLLQVADYIAGISHQRLKNPEYGNLLYQKYIRKKEGRTQIWPK